MSSDKYLTRGFSASGAHKSSYSAPRESYKLTPESGNNFLFGGSGLRGSPQSGSQTRSMPVVKSDSYLSASDLVTGQRDRSASVKGSERYASSLDLSGGDVTTTKYQRRFIFLVIFIGAVIFSSLVRSVVGTTDSSWVRERRSEVGVEE